MMKCAARRMGLGNISPFCSIIFLTEVHTLCSKTENRTAQSLSPPSALIPLNSILSFLLHSPLWAAFLPSCCYERKRELVEIHNRKKTRVETGSMVTCRTICMWDWETDVIRETLRCSNIVFLFAHRTGILFCEPDTLFDGFYAFKIINVPEQAIHVNFYSYSYKKNSC